MVCMHLRRHVILTVLGPSTASSSWLLFSSIPCPWHMWVCTSIVPCMSLLSERPWGGPLVCGFCTSRMLLAWSVFRSRVSIRVLSIVDVLPESIHTTMSKVLPLLIPLHRLTSLWLCSPSSSLRRWVLLPLTVLVIFHVSDLWPIREDTAYACLV